MSVTSVDARTLERAADLLALLHDAERAFCLEDVRAMWSAFDQVDPVDLRRVEGELRERASRAIELTSPLSESSPQSGAVPSPAAPLTPLDPRRVSEVVMPLHSVKVASEEPVTPALCWWLMASSRAW